MDMREAVVNRLYELMKERGLNPNALADISGLPHSTVKSIFNGGSQNPGVVTLKKLFDGLEVSVPDFYNTEVFRNLEQEIK